MGLFDFVELVKELGILSALKISFMNKIESIKQYLGFTNIPDEKSEETEELEYTYEYEEKEERESSPSDLLRFRFRMNPI